MSEAQDSWREVGKVLDGLGLKLKMHFERAQEDVEIAQRYMKANVADGKDRKRIGHRPQSTCQQCPDDQVLLLHQIENDGSSALDQRGKCPSGSENSCHHAQRNGKGR